MQADIVFLGMVQGVGFRYTAVTLAQQYGITGWVRNNPDGSVQSLAQGSEENIQKYIAALKNYFTENISNVEIKWSKSFGEDTNFRIIY